MSLESYSPHRINHQPLWKEMLAIAHKPVFQDTGVHSSNDPGNRLRLSIKVDVKVGRYSTMNELTSKCIRLVYELRCFRPVG